MRPLRLEPLGFRCWVITGATAMTAANLGRLSAKKSSAGSGFATGRSISSPSLQHKTVVNIHTADSLNASAPAAQLHLRNCRLCPFDCGPVREQPRACAGCSHHIASEMLHMGEESLLRPAHAIFFSGCTATCTLYRPARFAFHPTYGVMVMPEKLAGRILQRQAEGVASGRAFIGGDPTPHIPFILATLAAGGERRTIPAVFNSNLNLYRNGAGFARRSN